MYSLPCDYYVTKRFDEAPRSPLHPPQTNTSKGRRVGQVCLCHLRPCPLSLFLQFPCRFVNGLISCVEFKEWPLSYR